MQFGFDRAADQAGAFAENRDGNFVGLRFGVEQFFLREAAIAPQRLELEGVDLPAFRGKVGRNGVGEGEIDVVAAQQDVLTYRDALELQLARFLGDGDQSEIGGAAADIDYQHEIAFVDASGASRDAARSMRRTRPAALPAW